MSKILITGGAGFIGYHLIKKLMKNNFIDIIDNFNKLPGVLNFTSTQKASQHINTLMKLQNELFKRQFRSRFETLLLNNFSTTNILHEISLLKNTYTPEVIGHINRWGTPATFSDWQEIVEGLNAFAVLRPIEMKSQLNNSFKSPIITYPNPANNNIHISSSIIKMSKFPNNKTTIIR